MILTIVSPDKTSLSMFIDFYKAIYDENVKIFIFNSLFSKEVTENKLNEILKVEEENQNLKIIIYKIKPKTKIIPENILKASSAVIKFDIYSYTPEVLKNEDPGDQIQAILDRWNFNMEKLNG
jgi:hypothetical protein